MESAAVIRSFQYSVSTRPGMTTMNNATFSNLSKSTFYTGKIFTAPNRRGGIPLSRVNASEATVKAKSSGDANGAVLTDGLLEKRSPFNATFPDGFEALLTEVCDETEIAELKVKLGAFEIHMKRSVAGPTTPAPVVAQLTAPPVPTKPASESTPAPPPVPKPSKSSPFTNVSVEKVAKLAALEASGSNGFVVVSSPTVGSFLRARTLKGKKQPPACKEGDVIKEGQTIGFLDQFGTELPVKSDVAGEILKILYTDGEAVGYGDPLIAVLPSFPGIK